MTSNVESNGPDVPQRSFAGVVIAVAAAVAVAIGGLLHLRVWDQEYREIPDGATPGLWVVKTGFPLNAAASIIIAGLLVAVTFGVVTRMRRVVVAAAIGLEASSVAALVMSRGDGVFGWTEKGYSGPPGQILVAEVVAIALLILTIIVPADRRPRSD